MNATDNVQYGVINVLKFENNKLWYSTNEETWVEVNDDTITGYPAPNEMMIWVAGKNIKQILEIKFDDISDFDKTPTPRFKNKLWWCRMKPDATIGDEPKYDIKILTKDGVEKLIDPKIRVVNK